MLKLKGKSASNVMKRISTMRYELAKDMTPSSRPLSSKEQYLRSNILDLDGFCEYCRVNVASKGFGDHFYPIITKKYPTVYCNDDWNRIPACTTCNTGKSGKLWKDWFHSDVATNPMKKLSKEERLKLEKKFETYDAVMQKHCQRKVVDKALFDKLMTLMQKSFDEVDMLVWNFSRLVTSESQVQV